MALRPDDEQDDVNDLSGEVSNQEMLIEASAWAGPLPEPDILRRYDEILPGAAERILKMAENQQRHHHDQENRQLEMYFMALQSDSKRSNRGLWAGFAITLAGLGGGMFLVYAGHDWAGAAIAGLNLVSLAAVFVYGTRSRRAERADNADNPTS